MKKAGSITVFTALCLALIVSLLFALLEAARVKGLQSYADQKSRLALESAGAEYQRLLWQDYRLLCLDGAYGGTEFSMEHVSGVLKRRIDQNLAVEGTAGNLSSMELVSAEPECCELLTDGEGSVFLHRIAEIWKEYLPLETARAIYERYQEGAAEENKSEENRVENAQDAIEAARKEAEESAARSERGSQSAGGGASAGDGLADGSGSAEEGSSANGSDGAEGGSQGNADTLSQENPLDFVLSIKQNAILGMVVDVNTVSGKRINSADGLLNRNCEQGTGEVREKTGWYEKILAVEYVEHFFSDYTREKKDHALAYEMEYMIGGKDSDRGNLEAVVEKLLLLREAANVTHILSDSEKLNRAGVIAAALAGFTGNPAVVKVVQIGVVAAWAYLESVQDLRALLQGDKIALVKSREQWTVDLEHLAESFQSTAKARDCSDGLTYTGYLKQLLFTMKAKQFAYRALDVMEQNVRLASEYQNCRMDYMISRMDYRMSYRAFPFFAGFVTIGKRRAESFEIANRAGFSYEQKQWSGGG